MQICARIPADDNNGNYRLRIHHLSSLAYPSSISDVPASRLKSHFLCAGQLCQRPTGLKSLVLGFGAQLTWPVSLFCDEPRTCRVGICSYGNCSGSSPKRMQAVRAKRWVATASSKLARQ